MNTNKWIESFLQQMTPSQVKLKKQIGDVFLLEPKDPSSFFRLLYESQKVVLETIVCTDEKSQLQIKYFFRTLSGEVFAVAVFTDASNPALESIAASFNNAALLESELQEMFGVQISGVGFVSTPLLPDGFKGHPLLKSFTLAVVKTEPDNAREQVLAD